MTTPAREAGIKSSAAHAEKTRPGWGDDAATKVIEYAKIRGPGVHWTMEDARIWSLAHGLDAPPDPHAWGQVARKITKTGLVEHQGKYGVAAAGYLIRAYTLL